MSWWVESGVLDEGDSAGLHQDSFENHFRDMFLKKSEKLTWHTAKYGDPYSEFVLCILPIQSAHTQQWTHTLEHALRAQDRFRACLTRAWHWTEVETHDVRLKRLQFDVVIKTFCDWINVLIVKTKETEVADIAVGWPTLYLPCVNGVKSF